MLELVTTDQGKARWPLTGTAGVFTESPPVASVSPNPVLVTPLAMGLLVRSVPPAPLDVVESPAASTIIPLFIEVSGDDVQVSDVLVRARR